MVSVKETIPVGAAFVEMGTQLTKSEEASMTTAEPTGADNCNSNPSEARRDKTDERRGVLPAGLSATAADAHSPTPPLPDVVQDMVTFGAPGAMLLEPQTSPELFKEGKTPVEPLQILCIDDEPLLRELIKQILERDGHEVEVSDSGQSGLDEFRVARERGRPFDVVITDLGMPYLDGRQVAKALKQESPTTPVIMLTGWGAFLEEDGNTLEEVDSIISKPPRARELRAALSRFHPVPRNTKRDPINISLAEE